MTVSARGAVSQSQCSQGRQRPTLTDVLLRRRWRAENSFIRLTLARVGLRGGALWRWYAGEIKSLPLHDAIRRILRLSLAIDAVMSIPAAYALVLFLPAGLFSAPAAVLVSALAGLVVGTGSARRMGIFPFEALRRISPSDDSRMASLLARVEIRYLLHSRGLTWLPFPLANLFAAVRGGTITDSMAALGALVASGTIFTLGLIAGSRLGIFLARSRAQRRVGCRRWLIGTTVILISGLIGWFFGALAIGNGLKAVWSVMKTPADLLDDPKWQQTANDFLARSTRDAGDILALGKTFIHHADIIVIVGAIALSAMIFGLARLPATLIPLTDSSQRPRDAVDAWLSVIRRYAASKNTMFRVLVRRIRLQRWALAQHFWTIIQPTPEAVFFIGGALGLSGAVNGSPWTVAAILALAGTMAAHSQVTELRAELMPALGMSAEKTHIPLLLCTRHGIGIAAAVQARRGILAVHMLPSAAVTVMFLFLAAIVNGLPSWLALAVAGSVAASFAVAPLVQWYMGAVLITEAYAEREAEQGTGSSTATLQASLQGIPRMTMVVAPSFALIPIVVLGPSISFAWSAIILGLLFIFPILAFPVLSAVERQFARRVAAGGLDAWRRR